MAAVAWLVGRIRSVQRAIRFPGDREGAHRPALELALPCRCLIRSILLDLQFSLYTDVFEITLHQLRRVDQVTAIATADDELRFQALGMPSFGQQPLGILRIVLVVLCTLAELVDGQRPLGETTWQRGARFTPHVDRVD